MKLKIVVQVLHVAKKGFLKDTVLGQVFGRFFDVVKKEKEEGRIDDYNIEYNDDNVTLIIEGNQEYLEKTRKQFNKSFQNIAVRMLLKSLGISAKAELCP